MNAPELAVALDWDHRFTRLPETFYTRVVPTPLPDPYLVAFNPDAAALIGLDAQPASHPALIETLIGNRVPSGADPYAAIYAGHQFGTFVSQLGDGRAIALGDVRGPDGRRWDIQLKGAGQTPYSRMGDGRAVLRSSIREYLCSEAMHGLGIPTTRALAIVGSNARVRREQFETAAVVTRMAPCHVRFGSFELFYHRRQYAEVRQLADWVIDEHLPQLRDQAQAYVALLDTVVTRTAQLIAQWQAVGFCHGVMNTDNMSILGLTLDYGPFGFLDGFDVHHICNHSDDRGRYAYDMQPRVAQWNLYCLGQALLPLMEIEQAEHTLEQFTERYRLAYETRMRDKLGLVTAHADDPVLISDLLDLMHGSRTDFTRFFRALADFSLNAPGQSVLRNEFVDRDAFDAWAQRYAARLTQEARDPQERRVAMLATNPCYVLRNWMAEEAIQRARDLGDFGMIHALHQLLRTPFTEQEGMQRYAALPPDWATHISVSCSS